MAQRLSTQSLSLVDLVERARRLVGDRPRALLGITGAPGAGKSTLAAALVSALGAATAVLVPMDGFHLDDAVLEDLGRLQRKGAPDTFDAAGYVHFLRRLRAREDAVAYAPAFRREREQSVAGALPVPATVPLVVTEGNYLLADGPFAPVRELLDEVLFLDVDPVQRRERLVARHVSHGRSADEAEHWVTSTDDRNAALVDATRERADAVLRFLP